MLSPVENICEDDLLITIDSTMPAPILVDSPAGLLEAMSICNGAAAIAVDTEFMRTDTFYPILGLVQLCDGNNTWLADPLSIGDLSSLSALLTNPSVIKVFHSCSEDLEVLHRVLGVVPSPLFDTQVAASFTGHGFSRGYAALVSAVLGVTLDKHETRSDWLQRPLSDSQCRYAAEDVHFLLQVYEQLNARLQSSGRLSWLKEEMQALVAEACQPSCPDAYYPRIKGAWRLGRKGLAILRELAGWREIEARRRDKPRNRVIPDRVLLELAQNLPDNRQQLSGVQDLHPGMQRRYGDKLLELVAAGQHLADRDCPDPLPAPLPREARKMLDQCRDVVKDRAEQLDMAPEILARKKDLESLVRTIMAGSVQLPPALSSGWRHQQIGRDLENHAQQATL